MLETPNKHTTRPAGDGAVWGRAGDRKNPDKEKLAGLTYLVVDANRFARATVKDALHGMGLRGVVEMESAAEALDHVEQATVDMVLIGGDMPGMGGVEFVWRLRRHADARIQQIPVIMISEQAGETQVRSAINAGVHEFLPRPFSGGSLFTRIRRSILKPRPFIISEGYIGPDRRLANMGAPGAVERRTLAPKVLYDYSGPEPRRIELAVGEEPVSLPLSRPEPQPPAAASRFSATFEAPLLPTKSPSPRKSPST